LVDVPETKKKYVPAAEIARMENITVQGALVNKTHNAAIAVCVHQDTSKWGVVMVYRTPYVIHAPNVLMVNLYRLPALMTPILNAQIVPFVKTEKSLSPNHVTKLLILFVLHVNPVKITNSEMADVTAYRIGYVCLAPHLIRVLIRLGIGWPKHAVATRMQSVVLARHVMLVSNAKQDVYVM
jgi:hypothetical protein